MESETPPSAVFYNFLGWLDVNKKRLALVGGILVALLGVMAVLSWHREQRELQASQALSRIRIVGTADGSAPAGTSDQFLKVANEFPKTKAGARAKLLAAGALFAEGKFDQSQAQFDKFLREHPDSPWAGQAAFGIATSLDAQKKTAEATAKYEEYVRRYSAEPAADQARLNLGRLYESQNKLAQAVEVYDKMVKSGNAGSAISEAQYRYSHLIATHPNLAPTNAPPPRSAVSMLTNMLGTNLPGTNVILGTNLLPRITNAIRNASTGAVVMPTNAGRLGLTNLPPKP